MGETRPLNKTRWGIIINAEVVVFLFKKPIQIKPLTFIFVSLPPPKVGKNNICRNQH